MLFSQKVDGFKIAVKAVTLDGRHTSRADIGNAAELLTGIGVGNMHLNRRDANRLYRVKECYARVRIGAGVDNNAVGIAVRALDGIDKRPPAIRLKKFNRNPLCVALFAD